MPNFDSRYWNLSQAAAWVVYRKRKLVEKFSAESRDGWAALKMYPKSYEEPERVGNLGELSEALIRGDLTAWGRRNDAEDELEAIPSREWFDLWISPPSVKRSNPMAGQIEPWTDLRFESSDLKKHWRSQWETEGRTRFRWEVLEEMWHEICERLPAFSQNKKIEELQMKYESRYPSAPSAPSRPQIQTYIKRW